MSHVASRQSEPESYALPSRSNRPSGDFPTRPGELALNERRKQQGGVVRVYEPESANSRVMTVRHRARCECLLDRYRLQRKLTIQQFEAGMKFRQAWLYQAEGIKTRDSTMHRFEGSAFNAPIEALCDAERIVREVYQLLSPFQSLVIISVCASDILAGTNKRMDTLRRALNKLADVWGVN